MNDLLTYVRKAHATGQIDDVELIRLTVEIRLAEVRIKQELDKLLLLSGLVNQVESALLTLQGSPRAVEGSGLVPVRPG